MDKIDESFMGGNFAKFYRYKEDIKPVKFLETLASKGWEFDTVFIEERNFDCGMHFMDDCTLGKLKRIERRFDDEEYRFKLKANLNDHVAEIHFFNDSDVFYMVTSEPDFELEL